MRKPTFRQAMMEHLAPRLERLGYRIDPFLQDRAIQYGFSKQLPGQVTTQIIIQRRQSKERASGYSFTINLNRLRSPDVPDEQRQEYQGFLSARIGHVLYWVFGRQLGQFGGDYWWQLNDPEEFLRVFKQVAYYLKRYIIPWLENPETRNLGYISPAERQEFRNATQKIIEPRLMNLGYEVVTLEKRMQEPPIYVKSVLNGEANTLIVFRQYNNFRPPRSFGVMLQRRRDNNLDPYAGGLFPELYEDLGQLAWYQFLIRQTGQPIQGWFYDSLETLTERLEEVWDLLVRLAIPWLENPTTEPRWSQPTVDPE